ncbi:DUF6308 family protein [Kribbella caucasensis]|uniref:DUF6308 family protein n=1 Tax=Kribbella caucasensis TaxID=2512215 RepID=UPI00105B4EFF|nr:DUF6308 family protein [Kribbella sp. VKM Ac-2527]
MPNWRSTFAGIGFTPSGPFGAMRARIEDLEATVVEDGLGRLSLTFTHVAPRSAMQYEVAVPLDVTAQQVAQLLVNAFERAHPEAHGKTRSPHAVPEEYDMIRVGGALVKREQAIDWAREYLTGPAAWAYPAYDAYQARSGPYVIEDADLLAPVLLNVNRLTLKAYYGLQDQRDRLQDLLATIPHDAELISAEDDDLEAIRMLFGVLDDPGIPNVRGTILAKILHRKRPGFIPLYDEYVRRCYQDGERAPVPPRGRPWGEFFVALAMAMRDDLIDQYDTWSEIADLAIDPPISLLRALDIVAWRAGGGSSTVEEPDASAT